MEEEKKTEGGKKDREVWKERGGRKWEVAHREGTDKLAWPEFSTCPRAAAVLPLQHAALQCVCVCVCVCVLCASKHIPGHVYF